MSMSSFDGTSDSGFESSVKKMIKLEGFNHQIESVINFYLQSHQLRCWQKDGMVRCTNKRIESEEEFLRPS